MTVSVTIHAAAFTHLNGDTDPFNLEAKYVRVTWFESLASGTSGTLTLPPGAAIVLDAFAGGVDALCSQVAGGMPTYDSPVTAGGAVVAATLDAVGNWTLSGAPSAYPVALIYEYRVTLGDLDDTKMLGATMADTMTHGNEAHNKPFVIGYSGTGSPPSAAGMADGTVYLKYV